jgi:hypothetical protein
MNRYDDLIRNAQNHLQRTKDQDLSVDQQLETAKTYAVLALAEAIRSNAVSVSTPPRAASGKSGSFEKKQRRPREITHVRTLPGKKKSPPGQNEKTEKIKVVRKAEPGSRA